MRPSSPRRTSSAHSPTPTGERLRRIRKMNSNQRKACRSAPRNNRFSRNSSILLDLNSSIFDFASGGSSRRNSSDPSMKDLDLSHPRMDMLDSSTNDIWDVDEETSMRMRMRESMEFDDSARSTDSLNGLSDFFNARVQTFANNMGIIGGWIRGHHDIDISGREEEETQRFEEDLEEQEEEDLEECRCRNEKRQALLLAG